MTLAMNTYDDASPDPRQRLLDAARQIFAICPYDDVLMTDIAALAGVTVERAGEGFADKREIYLENLWALGTVMLNRGLGSGPGPVGPVVAGGLDAFLDFVEENPALYRALMRSAAGADEQAVVRHVEEAFTQRMLELLGVTRPSAQILVEMAGWLGFVQRSALSWLDHPELTRVELMMIQVRHLMSALRVGDRPD